MRRPQVDKKGRAVSWSFTEVGASSQFKTTTLTHKVVNVDRTVSSEETLVLVFMWAIFDL